jgi:membrane protein
MNRKVAILATILGAATAAAIVIRHPIAIARHGGTSEPGRGRDADIPEAIPLRGLKDVLWRVVHQLSEDRVTLIAAGVTFYLLLGLFPAISALVALYGLVADTSTMTEHLRELSGMLPAGGFDLIAERISSLSASRNSTLGLTFFASLSIALWSTHSATLAIFDAMNVAYDETEKRGLVRLNLVGLGFTICAMVSAALIIGLVAIIPLVLTYIWLDRFEEQMALIVRWPILFLIVAIATTAVYRFGPSRQPAKLRWLTWGSVLVTVSWFLMSLGFSFYLKHFANYDATYGTLGALIGFLVWIWLSILILIVGGELNAELEHQTAIDTTTGSPRPMGKRGAYVADTLGVSSEARS